MSDIRVVERQNELIRTQSHIIDDLFLLLMQHVSVEEAGRLPVISKIDAAAQIRKELEEGCEEG